MGRFPLVDIVAAAIDDALAIAHGQIVMRNAQALDQRSAGNGSSAGSVDDHLDIFDLPIRQQAGIDDPGSGDNRRAMLVIVEYRDIHPVAQRLLDDEAIGCGNIFQVDAAETGFHDLHGIDERIRILGVKFDIDRIDIGEALEQHRLALHHRFRGECAEIAQTQDRGAVGYHRNQIALCCIIIGFRGVFGDRPDRDGNAGRIGEAEIALGGHRLRSDYLDFSGPAVGMKKQCLSFGKFQIAIFLVGQIISPHISWSACSHRSNGHVPIQAYPLCSSAAISSKFQEDMFAALLCEAALGYRGAWQPGFRTRRKNRARSPCRYRTSSRR